MDGQPKPKPGTFQKGRSGNPSGRPKVVGEIRDLARSHTREAVSTLTTIMRNRKAPEAARVAAANSILDRGWGKPSVDVNATIKRSIDDFSDAELAAIVGETAGA